MNIRRNALPMAAAAMLLTGAWLVAPAAATAAQPSNPPAAPSAGSAQPDSHATPDAGAAPSAPSGSWQSRANRAQHRNAPVVQPPMTKQQKSREMPLPGQSQDHSATNLEEKK
jgi:hypothetical protein